MFRQQEDHISGLVKRFTDLDNARKEAVAKSQIMEEENAKLRILNLTATRALSEASVLNHNEALKAKAFETSHKSLLERIERDTARILQLRTEKDHYASAAQSLATEIDQQKGVIRRLQERLGKTFTAAMEDTRIEEFRAAIKTLRERGDRWKARALDLQYNVSRFARKYRELQAENARLKADLTKALDARTVQRPFKTHPGS